MIATTIALVPSRHLLTVGRIRACRVADPSVGAEQVCEICRLTKADPNRLSRRILAIACLRRLIEQTAPLSAGRELTVAVAEHSLLLGGDERGEECDEESDDLTCVCHFEQRELHWTWPIDRAVDVEEERDAGLGRVLRREDRGREMYI